MSVHEESKYSCGWCEYQATTKGSLDQHRRSVHEEMKYPCGQYEHHAMSEYDIEKHRKWVHEAMKYPCEQCEYEATTEGSIIQQEGQFMKKWNIFVGNVIIKQQRVCISIEDHFMKE